MIGEQSFYYLRCCCALLGEMLDSFYHSTEHYLLDSSFGEAPSKEEQRRAKLYEKQEIYDPRGTGNETWKNAAGITL